MANTNLQRRNRIRVTGSEPVGIEFITRMNKAGAGLLLPGSPAGKQRFETPKIQNERGISSQFIVTNVSQILLPADLNRSMLYLVNSDPLGVVWVSFGVQSAAGVGIRAGSGGGGFLLDNHVPTSTVYIIGDIASNPNVTLTWW
ncbi:MAG TPA: hypothetical protein VIY48_13785 [Candidatus Paceibacterota bacterium]